MQKNHSIYIRSSMIVPAKNVRTCIYHHLHKVGNPSSVTRNLDKPHDNKIVLD